MAVKKSTNTALQQKVKVLVKLYDSGCKTEKDLKALSRFRYDGYYRASGADRKKQALFLFGRCR